MTLDKVIERVRNLKSGYDVSDEDIISYINEAEMEIINLLDFTDRNELRNWLKANHNQAKSCWVITSRSKHPHTNVFHTLRSLKKRCVLGGLIQQ